MTLPVELLQTGPEHADLVRNLYQFYAYESSDWEQEDVEADGRFYLHEPHFTRYWQTPGWSASLILVDGFIAGFMLIERSELPGIDAWELADLFVLKKYRRQGVGLAVARRTLCEDKATGWCGATAGMFRPWRSARRCWPTCHDRYGRSPWMTSRRCVTSW